MKKKLLLLTLIIPWLALSCNRDKASTEDIAVRQAKLYYEHLAAGRFDEFMKGVAEFDSLPGDYQEQLTTNIRQFAARQAAEHRGIASVKAVRATVDTLTRQAQAFLVVCYADSVNEEIVVPMVDCDGEWKMR